MQRSSVWIRISCVLVALSVSSLYAQWQDSVVFNPRAEEIFQRAVGFYELQQYDTAAFVFQQLLGEYPRNHRATAAYVMGAKAWYQKGDYRLSIQLLKDLLDLYPHSLYTADAYYTLARNYIQLQRYEDAAVALIRARDRATDTLLIPLTEKALEELTSEKIALNELELIQKEASTDITRSLLVLRQAEATYRQGDVMGAQRLLQSIATLPPTLKYVQQALTLMETIQKRGIVKIGVLLPLMVKSERTPFREVGAEFLEGIRAAIDEYNQTAIVRVALDVRDSERDPTVAARSVADFASDEAVSVIVGPILSNEALASAGIANERGVPLITPTATANGIAGFGPFIFQANPDYEVRGRIAAQYALDTLKAKRLAVLAPSDAVGRQLVEAFVEEAKRGGAEIIAQQWYAPNAEDVRSEIESIRRAAMALQETTYIDFSMKIKRSEVERILNYGVPQHLLDSLLERQLPAPVELLFGPRGKIIADSLHLPLKVVTPKYDSLVYPVTNIDAIFVPLTSSDEIPVVSSQLKYYNIQAQILGTGDWYDVNELDQNRQYTDGVIFFVDSYVDIQNPRYQEFSLRYQQLTKGKLPTTNSLIGYDVIKLILQALEEGSTRRADVAVALARARYDGWHCRIVFSPKRVNTAMNILRYKSRTLQHLGILQLHE